MNHPKTILLVENEASIRKLVAMVLKTKNFNVLLADSGESAHEISRTHVGPIHLLLTDIIMLKLNGWELAGLICGVRKETRVVFMSGFSRETVFETGVCHEKLFFMSKPFSMQSMLDLIQSVLESTPAELNLA